MRMGVLGNAAQSELSARCAAKEFSALKQDKHCMSMRRYSKSKDNHVI